MSLRLVSLVVLFALFAGQAKAEHNCVPYTEIRDDLAQKYGESVVSMGVTSAGGVLQIFVNPDKPGTWTAVIVTPSGKGCPILDGEDWQSLPQGNPS